MPETFSTVEIDHTYIDQIFLSIVSTLRVQWPDFFKYGEHTRRLKQYVEKQGAETRIDYKDPSTALAFNKSFFLKNLYKNLMFMSCLQARGMPIKSPTYDLGSGMGPSTLAWHMLSGSHKSRAILIDRSSAQLHLAKKAMDVFKIDNVQYINRFVDLNIDRLDGTIFLSYWFCEQELSTTFLEDYRQLKRIVRDSLILIDYPERITEFENTLAGEYIFERYSLSVPVDPEIGYYISEEAATVNGCFYKPQ